jgi:hypothetical protein
MNAKHETRAKTGRRIGQNICILFRQARSQDRLKKLTLTRFSDLMPWAHQSPSAETTA